MQAQQWDTETLRSQAHRALRGISALAAEIATEERKKAAAEALKAASRGAQAVAKEGYLRATTASTLRQETPEPIIIHRTVPICPTTVPVALAMAFLICALFLCLWCRASARAAGFARENRALKRALAAQTLNARTEPELVLAADPSPGQEPDPPVLPKAAETAPTSAPEITPPSSPPPHVPASLTEGPASTGRPRRSLAKWIALKEEGKRHPPAPPDARYHDPIIDSDHMCTEEPGIAIMSRGGDGRPHFYPTSGRGAFEVWAEIEARCTGTVHHWGGAEPGDLRITLPTLDVGECPPWGMPGSGGFHASLHRSIGNQLGPRGKSSKPAGQEVVEVAFLLEQRDHGEV